MLVDPRTLLEGEEEMLVEAFVPRRLGGGKAGMHAECSERCVMRVSDE